MMKKTGGRKSHWTLPLTHRSVAQVGTNYEKTGGRKSRWAVPLSWAKSKQGNSILTLAAGQKKSFNFVK